MALSRKTLSFCDLGHHARTVEPNVMSNKPVNRQKVMCNFLSIPFLVVFMCSARKVKKIVSGATRRVPFPARTHTYRHLLTQTKGMWPEKINRRVTPSSLLTGAGDSCVPDITERTEGLGASCPHVWRNDEPCGAAFILHLQMLEFRTQAL